MSMPSESDQMPWTAELVRTQMRDEYKLFFCQYTRHPDATCTASYLARDGIHVVRVPAEATHVWDPEPDWFTISGPDLYRGEGLKVLLEELAELPPLVLAEVFRGRPFTEMLGQMFNDGVERLERQARGAAKIADKLLSQKTGVK